MNEITNPEVASLDIPDALKRPVVVAKEGTEVEVKTVQTPEDVCEVDAPVLN